ncbi:MAG: hypothetical protein Ct9H90mP27_7630 [Gammaproteobacteria bacterium]|nr:MAG: hypothetical protein Ct9H90mP27_7630 [Gammaproteobacteria bacterium]
MGPLFNPPIQRGHESGKRAAMFCPRGGVEQNYLPFVADPNTGYLSCRQGPPEPNTFGARRRSDLHMSCRLALLRTLASGQEREHQTSSGNTTF